MSIQKVLEMADRFVTLAEGEKNDGTTIKTPHNLEYQDQRTRLIEFFDTFTTQLRRIINEMGGDLFTLKQRELDPKLFQKFVHLYQTIIEFYKETKEDRPYVTAEKLAHYVLEKPGLDTLNDLEILLRGFTESTNVDFKPNQMLRHPEINSINALKRLAHQIKKYMDAHPLINPPGQSAPPAARLPDIVKEYQDFKAEQGDKTNPAVPFAKK